MAKDGFRALRVALAVLVGVVLWVAPGRAQNAMVSTGKTYYIRYCGTCHGKTGKGDGPLSKQMKKPAPDLTTLSKHNGGKFPYDHVLGIIDGDVDFPAHGSSEMPAWGETFQSDVPGEGQAQVRGRLMLVVDYLKSIQQK